jgi:hypothetical protein
MSGESDISDEYGSESEEPDFELPSWASFVVLGYAISQKEIVALWLNSLTDEEKQETLACLNHPDPKVQATELSTIEVAFRVHLQENSGIQTSTYSLCHPGAFNSVKIIAFCSTEPPNVIEDWFKIENVRPGKNIDTILKVGAMLGQFDREGNVKKPTWIIPDQACNCEALMRASLLSSPFHFD